MNFSNLLQVPVVVDNNGCNANADINFQFIGFVVVWENILISIYYFDWRIMFFQHVTPYQCSIVFPGL